MAPAPWRRKPRRRHGVACREPKKEINMAERDRERRDERRTREGYFRYDPYDPRAGDAGGFGFGGTSGSAGGFGVGGEGPQTGEYGSQRNFGSGPEYNARDGADEDEMEWTDAYPARSGWGPRTAGPGNHTDPALRSKWAEGRRATAPSAPGSVYEDDRDGDGRHDRNERRERDQRATPTYDDSYMKWRQREIEKLDKEYEEYCADCHSKFDSHFSEWRTKRASAPSASVTASPASRGKRSRKK
jgi:hypothetical protein